MEEEGEQGGGGEEEEGGGGGGQETHGFCNEGEGDGMVRRENTRHGE